MSKKLAAEQVRLKLAAVYLDDILAGRKTQTSRLGIMHLPAGRTIVLECADREIAVTWTGQHFRTVETLTARDAVREGFDDVEDLRRALRRHYPKTSDTAVFTCVRFMVMRAS